MKAMRARFGKAVKSGRKTLKLPKGKIPADADLVVTLSYKEGIGFYLPDQRRWVVSYPEQHHQRGLKKERATSKREAPEWAEPSEPYVFGELTIDYAERRVTLAGRPVQLTAIEYGLLFELSANASRVMTYDRLLQRVWGLRGLRRLPAGAHRRQAAPPQAGRRRQQPHLHPQRAPRRLSHGEGEGQERQDGFRQTR